MRKLKLQVQITLDGFMAGSNGEMDWMVLNWDNALNQYVRELTDSIGTIVMGRKLAEGFIPYWASAPQGEEPEGVDKMNGTPKVVFSRTLQQSPWPNAVVATGDLADEIHALKAGNDKDIIVYGGVDFVSELIKLDLVDEYHLFINPVAIGRGLSLFQKRETQLDLTLLESNSFASGMTVLRYAPSPKAKI